MSMEHAAYAFEWEGFEKDPKPRLERYLAGEPEPLVDFVRSNGAQLVDPDEGTRLTSEAVEDAVASGDLDYLAEAALTVFHDGVDIGFGPSYLEMDAALSSLGVEHASLLLGRPLRVGSVTFDPGRMGTYFCDRAELTRKRALADSLEDTELGSRLVRYLDEGLRAGGLYITF